MVKPHLAYCLFDSYLKIKNEKSLLYKTYILIAFFLRTLHLKVFRLNNISKLNLLIHTIVKIKIQT